MKSAALTQTAKPIDFVAAQRMRALREIIADDTHPFYLQLVAIADLLISVDLNDEEVSE